METWAPVRQLILLKKNMSCRTASSACIFKAKTPIHQSHPFQPAKVSFRVAQKSNQTSGCGYLQGKEASAPTLVLQFAANSERLERLYAPGMAD